MKLEAGKCIKCGTAISKNGRPTRNYNELVCYLDNWTVCLLGICEDCFLEESEFEEAGQAIKANGANGVNKIRKVLKRMNYTEFLHDVQQGKCRNCGGQIDLVNGPYIVTNEFLQHERCKVDVLAQEEV